jgi:carboxypeptidase D
MALPLSLHGVLINDGTYSSLQVIFIYRVTEVLILDILYSTLSEEVPVANFVAHFQSSLGLTNAQVASMQNASVTCGFVQWIICRSIDLTTAPRYQEVLDQLNYPPKGKIDLPNGNQDIVTDGCDLFGTFYNECMRLIFEPTLY